MVNMCEVCVIIPTYEEAGNLPKLINELEAMLRGREFMIIVVDDNSPDGTADVAEKLNELYGNILVHRRPAKLGIGSAVCEGIKIALSFSDCKYIVTMDADLSHDPKDLPNLLKAAEKADLVQGSRYIKGGKIIGWTIFRRIISYIANLLCRILFRTHLFEHTTNFRVYSRKCAETIVKTAQYKKYEWVVASILIAKEHNFRIVEIPITFTDRIHGKSKLKISDILAWFTFIITTFIAHTFKRFNSNYS